MQPDIEPKVERKPLSKSALKALQLLDERTNAELSEILAAAAEDQDINPKDGWGFDPRTRSWARKVE